MKDEINLNKPNAQNNPTLITIGLKIKKMQELKTTTNPQILEKSKNLHLIHIKKQR